MTRLRVPRGMPMSRLIRVLAEDEFERVAVEVPKGARAFRDPIDLDLLGLYAREHQIRLVVISRDPRVLRMAAAAGLAASPEPPAGAEAGAAGELTAAGREEPAMRSLHPPTWLMAGAFVLIILGAASVLWPRPTVVLTAARQRLSLAARAKVSPEYRESQIAQGLLPGRVLAKSGLIVIEVTSSGSKTVGDTPAQGTVVLINETAEQLAVPAGTIVQAANGMRFRTRVTVTVPAATRRYLLGIQVSAQSGQTEVVVQAEEPGSPGNLGPGKITAMIGPLGRLLKVINTKVLTGGTDRRMAVVAGEDIERGWLEARRQMELAAPDELRTLAGTEQVILAELLTVREGRMSTSPAEGEAGASVRVTLPYSARCLSLSRSTLAKFLEERARRQVPAHFQVAREAFALQGMRAIPSRPDAGEIEVTAAYAATGKLDRARVMAAVRGRLSEEARAALLSLPEVGAVQMDLAPGRRFPRFAWQIRLVLPRGGER